jgi:hypothetical protein
MVHVTIRGMWHWQPLIGYMAATGPCRALRYISLERQATHKWRGYGRAPGGPVPTTCYLVLTVVADLAVAIGVGVTLGPALRMHRRNIPPSVGRTGSRSIKAIGCDDAISQKPEHFGLIFVGKLFWGAGGVRLI